VRKYFLAIILICSIITTNAQQKTLYLVKTDSTLFYIPNNYKYKDSLVKQINVEKLISNTFRDILCCEKGYRLKWDDFSGKVDSVLQLPGQTCSCVVGIEYSYIECTPDENNNGIIYSVECKFNKAESWVREREPFGLKVQQAWLDLHIVEATSLEKELKKIKFKNKVSVDEMEKVFNKVEKKYKSIYEQFDKETEYGANDHMLNVWILKIKEMQAQEEKN